MDDLSASDSYSCTQLRRGDLSLALHVWVGAEPHSVVFYVHGTQSHAGWMFETGPALARLGCAVFALDRRGSGASGGARGDVTSFREWCDDYLAAMAVARERFPTLPMLLNGQSFGGAIAVGVACDPRACHDALLLSSPLLVPKAGFDLWKGRPEDEAVHVPTPDEWFTKQPRYLDFIRQDPLMVRALTRRFQDARIQLAAHCMALDTPLANRPCALVLPHTDPMIDLAVARDVYHRLTGGTGVIIELPGTDHYLEFSAGQDLLWRLQAAFARTFAYSTTQIAGDSDRS
ncbi:MAG: alpha/beta fold hydrolase [Deltaproteobacteria bacterium]|nr:alpha/beta fold hydrolase [Deltaproteobacteria bacterium]